MTEQMSRLWSEINQWFQEHKLTLSIAESCTGGAVSKYITDQPGASQFFKGAVVCYSNFSKEKILSIDKKILETYTAYHLRTAEEMARGVRELFDSDCAASITGLLGPGSDGVQHVPVGYIAVCWTLKVSSVGDEIKVFREDVFSGSRLQIRRQAVREVLQGFRELIELWGEGRSAST